MIDYEITNTMTPEEYMEMKVSIEEVAFVGDKKPVGGFELCGLNI